MVNRDATTLDVESTWHSVAQGEVVTHPALAWIWSRRERDRLGEVAVFTKHGAEQTLGRGDGEEGAARVRFVRQRPGRTELAPPIRTSSISREQLKIRRAGDDLHVTLAGRGALLINGREVDQGRVRLGDVVTLKGQASFLCVERPEELPAAREWPERESFAFGAADRFGLLGESPEVWSLRESAAFCGRAKHHVLILGASGTGKELIASAVHALSARGSKGLISRNAATLPQELVDAELFGNRADYPNVGMPEREGLIGAADGTTLFLDEIGELPEAQQAHLLRVLDSGEYTRLGESRPRKADLRLLSATNRQPSELKEDLVARHLLRIAVPSLNERKEDVPLLARHLLDKASADQPELRERFFDDGEPRLATPLVEALVRHRYTTHVRELGRLLWLALSTSSGDVVELTAELSEELQLEPPHVEPAELSAEQIREALAAADGNRTKAAEQLGLPSRFVLYRLMKKHGLSEG